ncbi:sensor histidine kinase [Thermoactinospora rubra]|uniref:sensor histidine kinase n=1 Tax=Thermoactinospora rubra TaxID=1088767 RepID=UPI000A1017E4|nr:sensor histidine kinase [Thermoactinospora rubra]
MANRWRPPWSARTWLETAHAVVGLPTSLLPAVAVFVHLALALLLSWTFLPARALLRRLMRRAHVYAGWQRSRFDAFLGAELPPPAAPTGVFAWRRADTWRLLCYHLLVAPVVGVLGFALVAGAWSGGLVMATCALWSPQPDRVLAVLTLFGILLLVAAPWIAHLTTRLDLAAARVLMGPTRSEELSHKVENLAASRAEVVAAADAERRRIERDLHDGAQQRLVSLAMNLGMARAQFTDAPEPVRQAIAEAHEEAKQAVKELRDLVRGLHPAILTEQGLDAALSGLAARVPLPVRLSVRVKDRPAPAIEAVAFFVVSEALTNITKHARAARAEIEVVREGDRLRLRITDDGRGGAKPGAGSGLRGLAQRVGSVDGTLDIDSPPGGPTTITVELPCA